MFNFRLFLFLFLLGLSTACTTTSAPNPTSLPATSDPHPLRVLFIGNSLTYRNDLPQVVKQLAAARGRRVETQMVAHSLWSLAGHWRNGEALRAIEQGHWDYVVLQDYSTSAVQERDRMFVAASAFDTAIRKAGAKTVLFMTWARRTQGASQNTINDTYDALGAQLHATVVPVGTAWGIMRREHPQIELHKLELLLDRRHPNEKGTYLAACMFVRSLLGESVAGLPADVRDPKGRRLVTVNATEALVLQSVVTRVATEIH